MKKLSLSIAVLMLVVMVIGYAQLTGEAEEVVIDESRTLSLMQNEAIMSLDSFNYNSLRTKLICYQVYEGLFYYNHEDKITEPRVAESYSISDDGTTYTFTLRDGVKFHNGDVVTVEDVVFSYERAQKSPAMTNHVAAIKSFTAVDDKTFEVKLAYPSAPFTQYISEIYIMSKAFVEANNNILTDVACGTGPYKIDTVDLSVAIYASAFEDYYRGEAKIKKIVWQIITDSVAASMAFQAGDLDYLQIAWSQISQLKTDNNVEIGFLPTLHTTYLAFNCIKEPFDDVRVRQAVSYLINREEIALAAFEGYAEVDSYIMHPNLSGMPDVSVLEQYSYDYNPEKGLALLEEAGFDTSSEINLGTILTLPESHYLFKPAQVIQAQLAEHKIKVDLIPYEASTMFANFFGGDYIMAVCGGSYGSDVSGYVTVHGSSAMGELGGCSSYLVDEEMDELFEAGTAEVDKTKRQEIYGEIMRILYENCPQTGLGHKQQAVAWHSDISVLLRLDYPLIYEWNFLAN